MARSPKDLLKLALNQEGLMLVTVGNLMALALGALIWFILARMLPVGMYGRANYILSVGALLSSFAALGLPITIQTYLPKGEELLLPSSIVLTSLASLVLGALFLWIHPSIPLIALSYVLFNLAVKERLGRREYKDFAVLQGLSRLMILFLIILTVPLLGIDGILYSFSLVYLSLSLWLLPEVSNLGESFRVLRNHLKFTLTTFLTVAVASMGVRLDKIVIGSLFGDETLGYYQLAFQFYSALYIIPTSLMGYLLPEKSSGRRTRLEEIAGLIISLLAALAGFALIPVVVRILFPRYYPLSSAAGQIVVMAIAFESIYSIWSAGKYSGEDPKVILVVNSISLVIFMALIYALGSAMGVVGLAISLLVYRITASLLGLVESRWSSR